MVCHRSPTRFCSLTQQELSSGSNVADILLGICRSFEEFVREGMEAVAVQQHQMGEWGWGAVGCLGKLAAAGLLGCGPPAWVASPSGPCGGGREAAAVSCSAPSAE